MAEKNDYQFVVSTDSSVMAHGLDRSHAIRTAFRVAASNSTSSSAPSASSEETAAMKGKLKGRFRLASATDPNVLWRKPRSGLRSTGQLTVKRLQPAGSCVQVSSATATKHTRNSTSVQDLGSSTVDPFQALPIVATAETDHLLKYCKLPNPHR